MEDFFTNKFVVFGVPLFGLMLAFAMLNEKDDVKYQFEYSYRENVDNVKINTSVTECIVFNSKEMTLKEAKTLFVKNNSKIGQLSVHDKCETNWFGTSVNKPVRLNIEEN